jgi:hypothetical protein
MFFFVLSVFLCWPEEANAWGDSGCCTLSEIILADEPFEIRSAGRLMYSQLLESEQPELAVLSAIEVELVCESIDCKGIPPTTVSKLISIAVIAKRAETVNNMNYWIAVGTVAAGFSAVLALLFSFANRFTLMRNSKAIRLLQSSSTPDITDIEPANRVRIGESSGD